MGDLFVKQVASFSTKNVGLLTYKNQIIYVYILYCHRWAHFFKKNGTLQEAEKCNIPVTSNDLNSSKK